VHGNERRQHLYFDLVYDVLASLIAVLTLLQVEDFGDIVLLRVRDVEHAAVAGTQEIRAHHRPPAALLRQVAVVLAAPDVPSVVVGIKDRLSMRYPDNLGGRRVQ